MTLGRRIQELRKGLGMSQEELGERMGVSRQAISKWEGDQTIPELDKLIALSKLFGLTVGQLLGVEQPFPAPAGVPNTPKRIKAVLAGMGAAILILAVLMGALWSQVLVLNRRIAAEEEFDLEKRGKLYAQIDDQVDADFMLYRLSFPQVGIVSQKQFKGYTTLTRSPMFEDWLNIYPVS